MDLDNLANRNLKEKIESNEYPGRGIVIGLNYSGRKVVQIYWVMGRSKNSNGCKVY